MLTSLARAVLWLKTKLRKPDSVVNIMETLATAKRILVCMPKGLEDFSIARHILPRLRECFPSAEVTLVLKREFRGLIDEPSWALLPFSKGDVSIWGLPSGPFMNKVKATRPDIAMDLNDSFQLFTVALIRNSGATLRICLEEKRRDPFFNFQVRTPRSLDLRRRYENLFRYLSTPLPRVTSKSGPAPAAG